MSKSKDSGGSKPSRSDKPSSKPRQKREPKAAVQTQSDSPGVAGQQIAGSQSDSTDAEPTGPGRTRFQKFEAVEIHRRQLKNAPYNPRFIDKHARKKLERFIKRKGLVNSLVWNRQTQHVVGGHQRIEILDALEGTEDYTLTVDMIDVPLEEEKVYNVALNNQTMQGNFDMNMLEDVLSEIAISGSLQDVGFDKADIQLMNFSPEFLDSVFSEQASVEAPVLDIMADIKNVVGEAARQEAQAQQVQAQQAQDGQSGVGTDGSDGSPYQPPDNIPYVVHNAANSPPPPGGTPSPPVYPPPEPVAPLAPGEPGSPPSFLGKKPEDMTPEEYKEFLKYRRYHWSRDENVNRFEKEFFAVMVFNSESHLTQFLLAFDLPTNTRHFSGEQVAEALGVELVDEDEDGGGEGEGE